MSWMESKVFIHCRCDRSTCSSRRKFSTAIASCSEQVCRKSSSSAFQCRCKTFPAAAGQSKLLPTTRQHNYLVDFLHVQAIEPIPLAVPDPDMRFRLLQQPSRSSLTSAIPHRARSQAKRPRHGLPPVACLPAIGTSAERPWSSSCSSSTADCTMLPTPARSRCFRSAPALRSSLFARVRA